MKNTTERNRRYKIEQKTKCLRTRRSQLPVKFLATVNEFGQRKTQLKCYKSILLPKNWYKIS